jgi:HPt (histidine-containing phosphotransfer) domain-containing protein
MRGKQDLLLDLVTIAIRECLRLLDEIRVALDKKDAAALKLNAHTLNGTVRYFGKSTAGEIAFQIEQLADNRELTAAAEAFPALQRETSRLMAQLEAYTQQH